MQLDITYDEQVVDVTAQAGDVNLLIKNAGVALFTPALADDNLAVARGEMEINYFGTLHISRAFAKTLANNGGGGIINIVSVLGFQNFPLASTYSASKAALHSATQALRFELSDQETIVVGVYPGPVETDLVAGFQLDKDRPAFIAESALDALAEGVEDIYPGAMASGFQVAPLQDPNATRARRRQDGQTNYGRRCDLIGWPHVPLVQRRHTRVSLAGALQTRTTGSSRSVPAARWLRPRRARGGTIGGSRAPASSVSPAEIIMLALIRSSIGTSPVQSRPGPT